MAMSSFLDPRPDETLPTILSRSADEQEVVERTAKQPGTTSPATRGQGVSTFRPCSCPLDCFDHLSDLVERYAPLAHGGSKFLIRGNKLLFREQAIQGAQI